jgi:hypothetical protein
MLSSTSNNQHLFLSQKEREIKMKNETTKTKTPFLRIFFRLANTWVIHDLLFRPETLSQHQSNPPFNEFARQLRKKKKQPLN